MIRRKPLPRSSHPIKRSRPRRKPRKKSETLRIYGPPARRAWMKTLRCSACGLIGYSDGAHVLGNGGTGRKADADTQAPLCGLRFGYSTGMLGSSWLNIGCHRMFDEQRHRFNEAFPNYNPEEAAAKTQADWLAFSGAPPKTGINQNE